MKKEKFNEQYFFGLYWRGKKSVREIAELWGVKSYRIYQWVEEHRIPIRRGKYTFPKELLHKWYWEDELTFQQIADNLGVDRNCVSRILAKVGVQKRNKSERMKLAWRRGDITNKQPSGEANRLWRGGRHISSTGYVLILCPEHPRAMKNNYVPEHILVWEKANGVSLPTGYVVHHLNGIKTDNRIANLVALPNMKHCHVLRAKAKRIQELEALLKNQGQLC